MPVLLLSSGGEGFRHVGGVPVGGGFQGFEGASVVKAGEVSFVQQEICRRRVWCDVMDKGRKRATKEQNVISYTTFCSRAGEGIRTLGPLLGKQMLYH